MSWSEWTVFILLFAACLALVLDLMESLRPPTFPGPLAKFCDDMFTLARRERRSIFDGAIIRTADQQTIIDRYNAMLARRRALKPRFRWCARDSCWVRIDGDGTQRPFILTVPR